MASYINTNVASLQGQNNLSKANNALATSLQRLSSGLRINSASDDAAGLAISSRMSSQINGLSVATRNANDGISLVQTADGAMGNISDQLQRMRDLAVQSANGTNTASDRQALQKEVNSLIKQVDSTADTTSFNGQKLLDGSFNNKSFQVGSNQGETIDISSIGNMKSTALFANNGNYQYNTSVNSTATGTAGLTGSGDLTINGFNVGPTTADGVSSTESSSSAIAMANAINAQSGSTGVTATANATVITGSVASTTNGYDLGAVNSSNQTTNASGSFSAIKVNGIAIGDDNGVIDQVAAASTNATDIKAADAINNTNVVAAINKVSSQTGVVATLVTDDTGQTSYSLTAADGRNIDISFGTNDGGNNAAGGFTAGTTHSTVSLSSTSADGIVVGGTSAGATASGLTLGKTDASQTDSTKSGTLDISTQDGAKNAITVIDEALKKINDTRADMGAVQNRMTASIANNETTSTNLSAARGRIQDTDFAKESANMTKNQVMSQAATSMLSQANSLPNNVMSLLK